VSSKRDRFKALLDSDNETGSAQKVRILNEHILSGGPMMSEETSAADENQPESRQSEEVESNIKSQLRPQVEGKDVLDEELSSMVSSLAHPDNTTVEDTYEKRTFLIEKDLLRELDSMAKGKKKGYKTKVVNTGLRIVIDLINKHQTTI
jgi:hypothetical protein